MAQHLRTRGPIKRRDLMRNDLRGRAIDALNGARPLIQKPPDQKQINQRLRKTRQMRQVRHQSRGLRKTLRRKLANHAKPGSQSAPSATVGPKMTAATTPKW